MSDEAKNDSKVTRWEPEDEYSYVLEVPPELYGVRDAAIEFALSGGEPPAGLNVLEEWFSNDYAVC